MREVNQILFIIRTEALKKFRVRQQAMIDANGHRFGIGLGVIDGDLGF